MIKTDIKTTNKLSGFSFKSKNVAGEPARISVTFHTVRGEKVVNITKRILTSDRSGVKHHTLVRKFSGKYLIEQVILLKEDSLFQIAHYTNLLHK